MKYSDKVLDDRAFHLVGNAKSIIGAPTPLWACLKTAEGVKGYGLIVGWDGTNEPVFILSNGRLAHFTDGTVLWVIYPS